MRPKMHQNATSQRFLFFTKISTTFINNNNTPVCLYGFQKCCYANYLIITFNWTTVLQSTSPTQMHSSHLLFQCHNVLFHHFPPSLPVLLHCVSCLWNYFGCHSFHLLFLHQQPLQLAFDQWVCLLLFL